MSLKNIWILAFAALLISWFLLLGLSHNESTGLSFQADAASMSSGWAITDGENTQYENSEFVKVGSLKDQKNVVLTKALPDTEGKSICFTTIGYTVEAFIDENRIYTFGSSLNGSDVWGVKTHFIEIPDGENGRVLNLEFSTNDPTNIAVSKYILLDEVLAITDALLKAYLIEIIFSILYISISVFILIYSVISLTFRFKRFDLSLLMLALIALFMGSKILFNIPIISLHTGPEFVYWSVSLINLALPIPILLFVAADNDFKNSRLIIAMSVASGLFFSLWLLCKIFDFDIFLLYWHVPVLIMIAVILFVTFIREFMTGTVRPEIFVSALALLVAAVLDSYLYYTKGNHYGMDYNLIIVTFPVLVLMTGKVVLSSVQKELHIINENTALRIEGNLLFENYNRLDQYIEETKKIWHDIDKHYAMISSLMADKEYDELKCYLEHMGHSLKAAKRSYLCDNRLINAILTDKIAEAESAGIKTSFSGNLPDRLNIQGNDLCSLLVNMLDNAIEACEKIPDDQEKSIDISIRFKNDFVYFGVSNSYTGKNRITEEGFSTSKKEKRSHGYGLSIMQSIVRKYDGAFDVMPSENSFVVKAALKNKDEVVQI